MGCGLGGYKPDGARGTDRKAGAPLSIQGRSHVINRLGRLRLRRAWC